MIIRSDMNNSGEVPFAGDKAYYKFVLTQKSYVYAKTVSSRSGFGFHIYNASGKQVFNTTSTTSSYNSVKDQTTLIFKRVMAKGTYYVELESPSKYTFYCTAEKAVSLSQQPTIKKITKPAKKKLKATWSKVSSSTGYEVQFSKSANFKKGVKKYTTEAASKTATKLKKGTRYYVRVRAYAIYGSTGQKVYSAWSKVKMATAK